MAKYIKITEEQLIASQEEIIRAIRKLKAEDGELNLKFQLGKTDKRATLRIRELASWKMLKLVSDFSSEVGWHGIAKRVEGEPFTYEIEDILIYPQEVTGATVHDDRDKCQEWYDSLPDEVFNNLRMQGHSHVNFGVTPSGTDREMYRRFLDQLTDDMFYIFIIWNKRNEKTVLIYDLRENILFETADVTVKLVKDGTGIAQFLDDMKTMVRTQTPSYSGSSYSSSYYSGSKSYGGSYTTGSAGKTATGASQGGVGNYGSSPADKGYATPPKGAATPIQPAPKTPTPASPPKPAGQLKRMGKPKGQWKKDGNSQKSGGKNSFGADDWYDDDYTIYGY